MSSSAISKPIIATGLTKKGPLALFTAGRRAFREVPGLRAFATMGFFLNLVIYAIVAIAVFSALYPLVVAPLADKADTLAQDGGFFARILAFVIPFFLRIMQFFLIAVSAMFSFLISLSLMGLWYEALAARIVRHLRGDVKTGAHRFTLGLWFGGLTRALKDSVLLLVISLCALLIGLIPFFGPILSLAMNSYLIGWELREPYLAVRVEMGEDIKELRKGLTFWTLRAGLLPVSLALIPLIGWFLLPFVMIYMAAGVAFAAEST